MGLRLSDVGSHTALDGTLPAEDGALVRLAMDLAIQADRATSTDPTDNTGQNGSPDQNGGAGTDRRSTAARQADVLIRWATDSLHRAHGPGDSLADDAHTVRTHLHILCRPDQLTAQPDAPDSTDDSGATSGPGVLSLAELIEQDLHGAPPAAPNIAGDLGTLSRAALRRLACDATIDLITLPPLTDPGALHAGDLLIAGLDGPLADASTSPGTDRSCPDGCTSHQQHRLSPHGTASPDPIDVGRSRRAVTGRLFRALITRDRHCIVKGCRRRPAQCAAHHVKHWSDGGPTDLHNLVLLCHQHHHDHHDRGHDLPHHDGHRWLTQTGWRHAPP
jgi:hypothetical protein